MRGRSPRTREGRIGPTAQMRVESEDERVAGSSAADRSASSSSFALAVVFLTTAIASADAIPLFNDENPNRIGEVEGQHSCPLPAIYHVGRPQDQEKWKRCHQ